jgi:hypothetical protein
MKGLPNFLAPPNNLFSFNFRDSLFAASRAPSRHGSGHATAFFFDAQLEHTIHSSTRCMLIPPISAAEIDGSGHVLTMITSILQTFQHWSEAVTSLAKGGCCDFGSSVSRQRLQS